MRRPSGVTSKEVWRAEWRDMPRTATRTTIVTATSATMTQIQAAEDAVAGSMGKTFGSMPPSPASIGEADLARALLLVEELLQPLLVGLSDGFEDVLHNERQVLGVP